MRDYSKEIARALKTKGGHLSIGRGGETLYYDNCQLSGCDIDALKSQAIAAGLPVIDSRGVDFISVACVAMHGPMVAVNRKPDAAPYGPYSHAPLEYVAGLFREIGAELHNI